MTKFLSAVLGAEEPGFSQNIRQLEQAAGQPSADIRLTEDIQRRTRTKIVELGLDPADTTGEELYAALLERLKADEVHVRQALGLAPQAAAGELLSRVKQFIEKNEAKKTACFVLKTSAAKRLLKAKPPKAAMKKLGYRSLDSMLKHEPVGQLYAAAFMLESAAWQRAFHDQHAKLTPADFEPRKVSILLPTDKRWHKLTREFVSVNRHNIVSFKELGVVIMLPMDEQVDGLAVMSLLLVLEELNAIRAHSSYTKLLQVKPDFGKRLREVTTAEAYVEAYLAGQPVSWRMIQRYFAQHPQAYRAEIFEPHVQPEDLRWVHAEDVLAKLTPALEFWQGTQALGLLHDNQLVSCNILDVALNYCNHLSFGQHVAHFVRDNVWHELMLRYLDQQNLEEALSRQLSDTLYGKKVTPAFARIEAGE